MNEGRDDINKTRRKQLDEVISKINAVEDELESILSDEEEYRDNIPENLQGSERYEMADNACSEMQNALNSLDEAVSSIEEVRQ